MIKYRIAFIGGGNMGEALIAGLLEHGADTKDLSLFEISAYRRNELERKYKIRTFNEIDEHIMDCHVVVIAVKPQTVREVLHTLSPFISSETLLISIAAGITIEYLERHLKNELPVVRTMPNIAARVGESAVAICFNGKVTEKKRDQAKRIMESIGVVIEVEESQINAVTGLSGSGPAYVFLMVEALADGGVMVGLSREKALSLAVQTVYGAAVLLKETGEHPAVLKDMITSPGGTTIEGLYQLEKGGLKHSLINAVKYATEKAGIIGGKLNE